MRILLTGAASALGRAIAAELETERHQLVLLDTDAIEAGPKVQALHGSLVDPDAMWRAVRSADAVIHTGQLPADLPTDRLEREQFVLDFHTRGTHVLFQAAVEAGVRRFIYGSTLDLFRPYPEDVYISEMWKPLPTSDIEPMSRYLGELTCREFARDFPVTVTALRLGRLAREEEVVGEAPDLTWLDVRDAARAFKGALARDRSQSPAWTQRWALFHICALPPNPKYLIDRAAQIGYQPQHGFAQAWAAAGGGRPSAAQRTAVASPPGPRPGRVSAGARKRVLFLGASGLIGPHLTPGLEADYDLRLADVKPHPQGRAVERVDITDYGQVLEAARGMDAIVNFTVVRGHPDLSFHVNTRGAWHVMKAAAELGIGKVVHSGPECVRTHYDHDFDIGDAPPAPGTGWYGVTKMHSREICRIYARSWGIQTPCFLFNGLAAAPSERVQGKDFPPFGIVWEDLHHACRLALEVESLPEGYQEFNLHSHPGQGKYSLDKARRLLGYQPTREWARLYRRDP